MIASDFASPPRRQFSSWSRYLSLGALYGLGVPVVRALDAAGIWPRVLATTARKLARPFGAYSPTAADVFVCAGTKSGTTWMLQIATQIAYRGAAEFENIHHVVPWPDAPPMIQPFIIPLADDSARQRAPTGLRVIKTHHLLTDIPFSPAARYIAVVRDPKDVVVSAYHFLKSMIYGPLMPSVDHWVDLFLGRGSQPGTWARHLAGYWRARHCGNVLFLTYEGLQRDMPAVVAQVANFMGVALTATELEAVVRAASWTVMKREQHKFDPGQVVPWSGSNYFLRKGQRGRSAELLTPAMQARIDKACRRDLRQLECDFPYDDAFT